MQPGPFFSERERPLVCHLSVTLVHPSQAVDILAIFLRPVVPWPSVDVREKFHGDRPRETSTSGV